VAPRNGPERFWARWPVRAALAIGLLVSAVVHGWLVPLDAPHALVVNDVEGEAAIPVDVLGPDDLPPPPPETNPASHPADDKKDPEALAAMHIEAPRADAGTSDAPPDAPLDGPVDAGPVDAGPVDVGPIDAGPAVDGAVALAHVDAGPRGSRDPEEIIGAATVRADVVLVKLVVNAEAIRGHPVGARVGSLLRAIPQWGEFMNGTDIDPVRDTDWLMILGSSLVNTARDSILIHYSAPDTVVDRAVDIVSRKYDHGGRFDAGVRGVKATLAHADRAERVILRPQPHLLAVVPPNVAEKNARVLVSARIAQPNPGEAMYLRVVDPHRHIAEIPESITELRMRIVPRSDEGADVFLDCDTPDVDKAGEAADGIRRIVRRHNDALTSIVTHGLLDHVDVTTEGSVAKARLTATRDQIETVVELVSAFLGVQPGPLPVSSAPTASPPSRSQKPR
jgi:hypothetical protein